MLTNLKKSMLPGWIILMVLIAFPAGKGYCQEVSGVFPQPGSTIEEGRPDIFVAFKQVFSSRKPEKVKFFFNHIDITGRALVTPLFISYKPKFPLKTGKYDIKVIFCDSSGKVFAESWSFSVKKKELIRHIEDDYKAPLSDYDRLTVTIEGEPGCKAWFDLLDTGHHVAMKEMAPGKYTGVFEPQKGDFITETEVAGFLETPDGVRDKKIAEGTITVFADLFRVVILSPKNDEEVEYKFNVAGRTRPGVTVKISSEVLFFGMVTPPSPNIQDAEGIADEAGNFKIEYDFPVRASGTKVKIIAQGEDKKGNKSLPDSVTIYIK